MSVLHGVARGLALILAAAAVGCGEDERFTPDPDHAAEVARNPYALTCGDIAEQSRSTPSQELVVEAEFALADAPVLRRRVAAMTENRVGRSIYWAMTEICEGRDASYTPARMPSRRSGAGSTSCSRGLRPGTDRSRPTDPGDRTSLRTPVPAPEAAAARPSASAAGAERVE